MFGAKEFQSCFRTCKCQLLVCAACAVFFIISARKAEYKADIKPAEIYIQVDLRRFLFDDGCIFILENVLNIQNKAFTRQTL